MKHSIYFCLLLLIILALPCSAQEPFSGNADDSCHRMMLNGYAAGYCLGYVEAASTAVNGVLANTASWRDNSRDIVGQITEKAHLATLEFQARLGSDKENAPAITSFSNGYWESALEGTKEASRLSQLAYKGITPSPASFEDQRMYKTKSAVYRYAERLGLSSSEAYAALNRSHPGW